MRAAGQLAGGSTALGCAPARRRRAVAAAATGGNTDAAAAHAAAAAAASGRDGRREVAVLGGEDFILSQRSGVEEELFKGDVLGLDADVRPPACCSGWRPCFVMLWGCVLAAHPRASQPRRSACSHPRFHTLLGPRTSRLPTLPHTPSQVSRIDFRQTSLRSLAHLPAGLRAPPRFLERVAVRAAGGSAPPAPMRAATHCLPASHCFPPTPWHAAGALCTQRVGGAGRDAGPGAAGPGHLGAQGASAVGVEWAGRVR